MSYLKVENRPDIVKDPESGALHNVDREKIDEYKRKKALLNNQRQASERINILESEVSKLRQEIDTIKQILGK